MAKAKYGPIDQIGYLVDNLEESVGRWVRSLGVGPWTIFRDVRLDGTYRGRSGIVTMEVALAYQGTIQIELIKITNETPSPYRDDDGEPLLGVHHVAWLVDDLESVVTQATSDGMRVVFRATNPATEVAYMEVPGERGTLFEFIQGAGMRAMINAGIAATRTWDGSNPIIEIEAIEALS